MTSGIQIMYPRPIGRRTKSKVRSSEISVPPEFETALGKQKKMKLK